MQQSVTFWGSLDPTANLPANVVEAVANIDAWYEDNSIPFFSREAIWEVHQQLQRPLTSGGRIFVRRLDGVKVGFEVRTGETKTHNNELLYTTGAPHLKYISLQSLKDNLRPDNLHLAYCNLRISHFISGPASGSLVPYVYGLQSEEETSRLFNAALHVWEESEMWETIKQTLISAALDMVPSIQNIIGFACGSMSFSNNRLTPALRPAQTLNFRSAFQHALLVSLHRLFDQSNLNKDSDTMKISCFAQDPIYTNQDKSTLERAGIRVLSDPEGFLAINDSSIVVSCAPDIPVKQIVADIARPAILIWDKVLEGEEGEWEQGLRLTDPDAPRVRRIVHDDYKIFEFPDEEHFSDMAIYVRQGKHGEA